MLCINNQAFFSLRLRILFICAVFLFPNALNAQGNNLGLVTKVVIDAGHGGKDPGAQGKSVNEKDITLSVALKLGDLITSHFNDVKVVYTRDKDVFIPLNERSHIANKNNANLFISIHVNANKSHVPYGAETYVMGLHKSASNFEVAAAENAAIVLEDNYNTKYEGFNPNSAESYIIFSMIQSNYLGQSLNFAQMVQNEMSSSGRTDRGVKQAGFLVLWKTSMPCVLVELGFLSNANEERYLKSEQGQQEVAEALYRSFAAYKRSYEGSQPSAAANHADSQVRSSEPSQGSSITYRVQITAAKNQPLTKKQLQQLPRDVDMLKVGNVYKYVLGTFSKFADADRYLNNSVKSKYHDAFVIAIEDGKLITIKEALQKDNK